MVRYLVGTLVDVGLGHRPPDVVERLLGGEEGIDTSPPAPPEGLYLASVAYPADAGTKPPRRRGPQLVP